MAALAEEFALADSEAEAPSIVPGTKAAHSFTLTVNCAPVYPCSATVVQLTDLIESAAAQVCAANRPSKRDAIDDLVDAAGASNYQIVPFGRGPAAVAALVRANVARIPDGAIVVASTSTKAGSLCIEALIPLSTMTVWGR